MALKLKTKTAFGFDAEYWRVDHVRYLKEDNTIFAIFGLYLNAEAAALAKNGFQSVEVYFTPENFNTDWRILAYNKAKESVLSGSEDC